MLSHDRRSHHPATRIMFLYWHMTGEVIIQLPGYCLYTYIWQEKPSSSYLDNVSILSYDWRSHHPATQIMSLYSHMTGEVVIHTSFVLLIIYRNIMRPNKNTCVSDRPTDPNIFYAKKKIDRQNPEIHLRFRACFWLQQFSSFPCTFDRCLEPKTLYCMSNN
jgi:hypothetical protein